MLAARGPTTGGPLLVSEKQQRFANRLKERPILGDGAMGTQLVELGHFNYDRCLDELSLSDADLVKTVHLDYISAGSDIIETNTFGANRVRLSAYRLENYVAEINKAAVRIAQEARMVSGRDVWICGAVGPLGRSISSLGYKPRNKVRSVFEEQIHALHEAGVDLLSIETFGDLEELELAVSAAKDVSDAPIIAQATFTEEGKTLAGDTPLDIVKAMETMGVTVLGANCSVGSEGILRVLKEMIPVTELPLSAQPNAGFPTYRGNRVFYQSSPEYMARLAHQMVGVGAVMIGGCCGTTPEHISAIRDALQTTKPRTPKLGGPLMVPASGTGTDTTNKLDSEPSELSRKIGKQFIFTVEVDPPRGFDISEIIEALSELKASGLVDALNVADNPRAQTRVSALAMSALAQNQLGMETILHLTLRHRNLVALQSDLLGAHALGVRNVLVLMGDPPSSGDYPRATSVADIVPSKMVKLIRSFNDGVDFNGKSLNHSSSFLIGCAFNPSAENLDKELLVLDRKLKAGADFILTQPVYSPETLDRVKRRFGEFPVPLLLGVLPLRNYRHAEFLHNEVPGIFVPKEILERLRLAGNRGVEVGMQICLDLLKESHQRVSGTYLIPTSGNYTTVLNFMREIIAEIPDLLGNGDR